MNRPLITILFFILGAAAVHGQDVTVSAAFDSSRIYIGDQITFTMTVEQPKDLHLDMRTFRDTLCKKIEILAGPVFDTVDLPDNKLRVRSKYLVTSFDTGFYQVPPVYAEHSTAGNIKRFYSGYTPLEVIRVKIAPADTAAKIFDIIKPYKAPLTLGEIFPWILAAIAAAALLWGSVLLFKRLRKQKGETLPVVNPDPAHIIAFRELEALKQQKLWQQGEIKLYYTRLTEILRRYLENRYSVFSLELTTSETLDELVRTGFKKDDSYYLLKNILTGSDLVKFAKYRPEPDENEKHFADSWKFVEITMVKETPEAAGDTEGKEVNV